MTISHYHPTSRRGQVRALSLLSGGLDSRLAVRVVREQDILVEGVVFDSPFFSIQVARDAAVQLDIPLHVVSFTRDIVSLLNGSPHGFGSCMNPCIDCHSLMLTRAGEMMEAMGFDFLLTGEVLNQRPMSQTRRNLGVVADGSGYADLIVRPLSAGLLPETKPEREGWVDRTRLLSLSGRGRKPQIQLAEQYGLTDFPTPAGGCLLTEPSFCRRLSDLQRHEGLSGEHSLRLLRYGRHLRLGPKTKVIIGRNEKENAFLEGTAELYDLVLKMASVPGPTGLLPFTATEEDIRLAASLCVRYSDHKEGGSATVRVRSSRGVRAIEAMPASEEDGARVRI